MDHLDDLEAQSIFVLREAFARLDPERRLALTLSYVDRVGIDGISKITGVHRATAARWLESARISVFNDTRELVRARAKVSESDFESLVKVMYSELAGILREALANRT